MSRRISQRELRNESGRIMRALDKGESFTVTRNGEPVGELVPVRPRVFVAAETVPPRIDAPRGSHTRAFGRSWTPRPVRIQHLVAEPRHLRGLVDTSVVIDLAVIDPARLPRELAVSAITLAELATSPHPTRDPAERARVRIGRNVLRRRSNRCLWMPT